MPIGTEPAMTVSGAAAATTMKTMAPGPSRPRSRCGPSAVLGGLAVAGGAETVAMRTSGGAAVPDCRRRGAMGRKPDRLSGGAGYTTVIFRKRRRDIEWETPVTGFSFENRVVDTSRGYARPPARGGPTCRGVE